MALFRGAIEALLLAGFHLARLVFVVQAIAFGTGALASVSLVTTDWPSWATGAFRTAALLSATLMAAGLLLPIARRWEQEASPGGTPTPFWALPFGFWMLLLSGLAIYAGSRLPALWADIGGYLDRLGFWDALGQPDPTGGIVLLPILLALFVPLLVTATAAVSIGLPPVLVALLPPRRPAFPALLGMAMICQAALAAASWLAVGGLRTLAAAAGEAIATSGGAEVIRVGDELAQMVEVLAGTASALLVPALGLVAWVLALRPWTWATAPQPDNSTQFT